jgi:hypothetical protein
MLGRGMSRERNSGELKGTAPTKGSAAEKDFSRGHLLMQSFCDVTDVVSEAEVICAWGEVVFSRATPEAHGRNVKPLLRQRKCLPYGQRRIRCGFEAMVSKYDPARKVGIGIEKVNIDEVAVGCAPALPSVLWLGRRGKERPNYGVDMLVACPKRRPVLFRLV